MVMFVTVLLDIASTMFQHNTKKALKCSMWLKLDYKNRCGSCVDLFENKNKRPFQSLGFLQLKHNHTQSSKYFDIQRKKKNIVKINFFIHP